MTNKNIHFIKHEDGKILITSDSSKLLGTAKLKYGQEERTYISDLFHWMYMRAFFDAQKEGRISVEMDEDALAIWNSRPKWFDE